MYKILKNLFTFSIILFLSFSTGFAETENDNLEKLKIVSTDVVAFNQILVIFNLNLLDEEGTTREFTLTNKDENDIWGNLYSIETELDEENKKELLVTFSDNALPNGIYELFVMYVLDENGDNIESGIDGLSIIQMPNEIIPELNSAETEEPVIEEPVIEEPVIEEPVIEEPVIEEPVIEEPVIEEPVIEEPVIEEPVIEEPVTEEPELELNSGKNVDEDFIVNNIESESREIESLPETGPANLFMFILASILALLIFVFRFKKS